MAEQVFADFSGGMNASGAVDKLDPRECLLAENVRLDELGNVRSAGALTRQNTTAYHAAGGTNTNYVHSLYWNPSLGAVAGVGRDVFIGATLGGLASGVANVNGSLQKMAFASAPGKVYFDPGSTGYWTDISKLVTVDWAPPAASGGTGAGPNTIGTATQTSDSGHSLAWIIGSTSADLNGAQGQTSEYLRCTMSTSSFGLTGSPNGIVVSFAVNAQDIDGTVYVTLLRNGSPVGDTKSAFVTHVPVVPQTVTLTFGDTGDTWGTTWSQDDANSATFGFQVVVLLGVSDLDGGGGNFFVFTNTGTVQLYEGGGFVAGTGAAGSLTGTYTWKVTFEAANGEESDASSASAGVILSANQGTLTAIPTGDSRTTGRNVYRKGGSLTSYYLVGSIGDNLSTTYADNQTDAAALSEGDILAGETPGDYPNTRLGSQQVRFPCLHYDRIFWVDPTQPNRIIWSKPLNGFAYPSVNFLNVGDSKPITGLLSMFGELIIIKTDSPWRMTGNDESSFDLSQIPSSVGTDMPFTITANGAAIRFVNRWGTWLFNGYSTVPLTDKLDSWFRQEDKTSVSVFGVNGFHPPEVSSATVTAKFAAAGNSEKMYWAYAESGQSLNNAILAFDLRRNTITKRALGASPLSLACDPVTGSVYVGDSTGFVSLLDDVSGTGQGGSDANFDFQTCYIDLERGSNKTLWAVEFFINTHGETVTPYLYYDNGVASEALTSFSTSGLQRVVRKLEAAASRKLQNFSVRLNGSTNINASGTPQIQLVHIKALYDIRTGRARTGQTS